MTEPPPSNPDQDACGSWDRVIDLLAFLTAVYHLVVVGRTFIYMGIFYPTPFHRAVSLTCALLMAYLIHMRRRTGRGAGFWADLGLLVMAMTPLLYIILFYDRVTDYDEYGFLDLAGMALAFSLAISLLVALKRAVGWVLVSIICVFLTVARFQNILPGLLFGKGCVGFIPVRAGKLMSAPFDFASLALRYAQDERFKACRVCFPFVLSPSTSSGQASRSEVEGRKPGAPPWLSAFPGMTEGGAGLNRPKPSLPAIARNPSPTR